MAEQTPLISIIVPCYNQAQHLSDCLQSVIDQAYKNWECIVVNDGSPDNTENVAREWCRKDKRIRYLKKENGGLVSSRNAGISIALGKWVLPLDADDKIGGDYLSLAVDVMKTRLDTGIIYCDAEYFGVRDGSWKLDPYTFEALLAGNMIFCTAFFKKEDWERVGGYDPNMIYGYEDWEFWINLLSHTWKDVIKLDYVGFFYRIKTISMRKDIDADNQKIIAMHTYVFEKYKPLYIQYFGSFQMVLQHSNYQGKQINNLSEKIIRIEQNHFYKLLKKIRRFFKKN